MFRIKFLMCFKGIFLIFSVNLVFVFVFVLVFMFVFIDLKYKGKFIEWCVFFV